MANKTKTFFQMTPEERDADVARYHVGVEFENTSPLTPAQRKRFERARTSQTAAPPARVLISVDTKLLAKAHARSRREGKTFSLLVSELLRASERRAG